MRVEDRLDRQNNYSAWKERIQSIFEEAEVWGIMVNTTQNLVEVPTDPVQLAEFRKKNVKEKILILEGIKDHVIPHVRGKTYAHEIWTTLTSLYQSSNENRKMVLKEKMKAIKMAKTDSATTYLTKITSVRDELVVVGEIIAPTELVRIALNGLDRTDSTSSNSELCEIWHHKMGHMYHGALSTLREITTGVPDFSSDHLDVCRGCAMGKFARSPFPSRDNRVTEIFDLIHTDVSGRMSHVSLSGYEYYVLFIDDHSKKTCIYFLKTKSEVFKWF